MKPWCAVCFVLHGGLELFHHVSPTAGTCTNEHEGWKHAKRHVMRHFYILCARMFVTPKGWGCNWEGLYAEELYAHCVVLIS